MADNTPSNEVIAALSSISAQLTEIAAELRAMGKVTHPDDIDREANDMADVLTTISAQLGSVTDWMKG